MNHHNTKILGVYNCGLYVSYVGGVNLLFASVSAGASKSYYRASYTSTKMWVTLQSGCLADGYQPAI